MHVNPKRKKKENTFFVACSEDGKIEVGGSRIPCIPPLFYPNPSRMPSLLEIAKTRHEALLHLEKAAFWNRDACENAVEDAVDALADAEARLSEKPEDWHLRNLVEDRKEQLVDAQEALEAALNYQSNLWNQLRRVRLIIEKQKRRASVARKS